MPGGHPRTMKMVCINKLTAAYVQRHHVKRLESLGFKVILEPLPKAA